MSISPVFELDSKHKLGEVVVIKRDGTDGTCIPFIKSVLFGRSEKCDIILALSNISRKHVKLTVHENGLATIANYCKRTDATSVDGVFVGCNEEATVEHGSVLCIGARKFRINLYLTGSDALGYDEDCAEEDEEVFVGHSSSNISAGRSLLKSLMHKQGTDQCDKENDLISSLASMSIATNGSSSALPSRVRRQIQVQKAEVAKEQQRASRRKRRKARKVKKAVLQDSTNTPSTSMNEIDSEDTQNEDSTQSSSSEAFNAEQDVKAEKVAQSDLQPVVEIEQEQLGESDNGREVEAGNEVEVEADNEVEVEAGNEVAVEADNEVEVEVGNEVAVKADNEVEVEVDNEVEMEADNEVEVEDGIEVAVEADNKVEVEVDNEVETEADNKVEMEADNEVAVEADNEVEVEDDNEAEIESDNEEDRTKVTVETEEEQQLESDTEAEEEQLVTSDNEVEHALDVEEDVENLTGDVSSMDLDQNAESNEISDFTTDEQNKTNIVEENNEVASNNVACDAHEIDASVDDKSDVEMDTEQDEPAEVVYASPEKAAPPVPATPMTRAARRRAENTPVATFAVATPIVTSPTAESGSDGDEEEFEACAQLKVVELRKELKSIGLLTTGRKAELVNRLASARKSVRKVGTTLKFDNEAVAPMKSLVTSEEFLEELKEGTPPSSMTVFQLRQALRAMDCNCQGLKSTLVARLQQANANKLVSLGLGKNLDGDEYLVEGHDLLGGFIKRDFDGELFDGIVVGFCPETEEDGALFHVLYEDGDVEDLDEAQVEEALERYAKQN